jgi:DNA-binding Xre family transcriptional regulator
MAGTRILKTNRQRLLSDATRGKAALARELGIHLTTLNSILDDKWERIERDTIEGLCDYLNCELSELFSLEPDPFWTPLIHTGSYRILRGVITTKDGVKKFLEEQAKTEIVDFLQGHLPSVPGGFKDCHGMSDDEIVQFARDNNCIVIGAHHSNRAFEVLVSHHFSARPFNNRPDNRQRIPFRFVRDDYRPKSTITESLQGQVSAKSELGVYSQELGRIVAQVDRRPSEDFLSSRIDTAQDAAIILVVNKPFGTEKNVKLIVLAGFTRLGTLAAAKALTQHHRDLEPQFPNHQTVGVIKATYSKPPESDSRKLRSYEWVLLSGGRRTVAYRQK